ncbi:MAG: hypothetical protein ACE5F1_21785 [Planctomycetota bacterium]
MGESDRETDQASLPLGALAWGFLLLVPLPLLALFFHQKEMEFSIELCLAGLLLLASGLLFLSSLRQRQQRRRPTDVGRELPDPGGEQEG